MFVQQNNLSRGQTYQFARLYLENELKCLPDWIEASPLVAHIGGALFAAPDKTAWFTLALPENAISDFLARTVASRQQGILDLTFYTALVPEAVEQRFGAYTEGLPIEYLDDLDVDYEALDEEDSLPDMRDRFEVQLHVSRFNDGLLASLRSRCKQKDWEHDQYLKLIGYNHRTSKH